MLSKNFLEIFSLLDISAIFIGIFLSFLLFFGSAYIAESAEPDLWVTLIMSLVIAFKGRMILDRFMELETARPGIRRLMNIYFYVIPALIVLVYLFPQQLADLTRLWTTNVSYSLVLKYMVKKSSLVIGLAK